MATVPDARVHFFVDGPNIDATLGTGILSRKPNATDRPRWDRVNDVARTKYGAEQSCFVLNGDSFNLSVAPFYRTLIYCKFKVATPKRADWCDADDQDPVDEFIKDRLASALEPIRTGELSGVLVASHDGGYASALGQILAVGGSVAIVGFLEWLAPELVALRAHGAVLLDLEHDFGGFDGGLDRPEIG